MLIADSVDKAALDILGGEDQIKVDSAGAISHDEAQQRIGPAHALIIRSGITVDAGLLAAAPNLKAIARAGVGVDNVDVDEATRRGIIVMNTPEGNTVSATELTFALMLALARNIPQAHDSIRAGRWDRQLFVGVELRGKTLGLIGFGRIGQAVARRAQAFEMIALTHDPYVPARVAARMGVEMVDLPTLYARSDFISLHSLATAETRGMINASALAQMKRGVRIVNAARGALIVPGDLAAAIREGQVAGAALDVYEPEPPPPDNPLIGLEGVIHTPHLGASTTDAQVTVAMDAAEQIVDGLLHGQWRNVVNPTVLR